MTNMGRIILASVPRRARLGHIRDFSALVSPAFEFPGLPETSPQAATASKFSVSTLPNGLTVVSEDASTSSTISLTFPKAGSNNESLDEAGAALANKCLAFKSGFGLSNLMILRYFEDEGAVPFASAGRTSATVGFTCPRDKAPEFVPLLAAKCDFEPWDVRDAIQAAKDQAEVANSHAHVVLTEQLFAAGYGPQSPMGRPYFTSGASASAVESFRQKAYGLNGAVLAATGIEDHTSFCEFLQTCFEESDSGDSFKVPIPVYVGGESRVHSPSLNTAFVSLAFQAPASSVVANILKECFALKGCSAFVVDGLIGVYGSNVDELSTALTTKPTADVLKLAKVKAKANAAFSMEEGSTALAKIMTAQVLETGSFPVSYDEVTEKAVAAAYDAMIKTPLTMASVGNLYSIPYYSSIQSRFS